MLLSSVTNTRRTVQCNYNFCFILNKTIIAQSCVTNDTTGMRIYWCYSQRKCCQINWENLKRVLQANILHTRESNKHAVWQYCRYETAYCTYVVHNDVQWVRASIVLLHNNRQKIPRTQWIPQCLDAKWHTSTARTVCTARTIHTIFLINLCADMFSVAVHTTHTVTQSIAQTRSTTTTTMTAPR